MGRDGFGFDPPPTPDSAELGWVLTRAFSETAAAPGVGAAVRVGRGDGDGLDGAEAARLASALRLAVRVGYRVPAEVLAAELGEGATDELLGRRRNAVGRAMVLEALALEVEEVALAAGVQLVVLKGMALQLLGLVPAGSRTLADVDVLVAEGDLETLVTALSAAGFEDSEAFEGAYHHHLAPLVHPKLGVLEIHWRMPGVVIGGAEATMVALLAAGEPAPGGRAARAGAVVEGAGGACHRTLAGAEPAVAWGAVAAGDSGRSAGSRGRG